jgi:hypothetical protein
MPDKARYGVKFVGYSAFVIARKYGREIDYAQLDFVAGGASIHGDDASVIVPNLNARICIPSIALSLPMPGLGARA